MILCSDKSSERNLSCFFDMRKPKKMEHLQKEEPFSSDPYFNSLFQQGFKTPFHENFMEQIQQQLDGRNVRHWVAQNLAHFY